MAGVLQPAHSFSLARRGRRRATKHGYTTMSDAREQFAACEALLTKGDVDACAAAANFSAGDEAAFVARHAADGGR